MSWDWDWALDDLTLADVASAVVLEDEGGGSFADRAVQIPGRDGVQYDAQAPFGPIILPLRLTFRYTDSDGLVTHANGRPGHIKENLSAVKKRLSVTGLSALRRTDPDVGRQRALVKLVTDPLPGGRRERFSYRLLLSCPSGSWQDNTATTQAAGSVSTSGDRRIFDPVIEIGAAGTLVYPSTSGTTYTITAASGPTYPVTVDVGAGTVLDNASADASGSVSFSDPRWLVLDTDRAQAITGTAAGSSSVTYRNRWG